MLGLLPLAAAIAFSTPRPKDGPRPHRSPRPAAISPALPEHLLSSKALRRMRLAIELRLAELRDERFNCVRAAILARLPPEMRPAGAAPRCLEASPFP
ncbi:MAG TPA: hypothetical protein VMH02_00700 [Verrucomicrobiae bacterium]|nr:hypothetical protein [Verrucomicrobiae bacterium]